MSRSLVFFAASSALVACASARPSVDLQAQIRRLEAEQTRQARRLDLLENRVVLAEDSARMARQALSGVGPRSSIRIADGPAGDEPIPSSAAGSGDEGEEPAPGATDADPRGARPVVRSAGRERLPESPAPFVVREADRLPTAPVPAELAPATPAPSRTPRRAPSERGSGPDSLAPQPAAPDAQPPEPGTLDPRAAPAYERGLALARGGRCDQAQNEFAQFLVRFPGHPFADNAMYWRAECILAGGDVARAAQEFEGLLARFPVGNKAPDALFKLAQCYRRLGDTTRARATAARLVREYPRSELAGRVREGDST